MAKPISMDDRYRAANRIARVLKRWPLSANDILEYLAIASLRSIYIAIGFYLFLLAMTLPQSTFADIPIRQMVAGYGCTLIVPVALAAARHYLLRLRDSASTSGPMPWLGYLNTVRWVFIAMVVVFFATGAWLYYQRYTGSVLVGFSDLGMAYWYTGMAALFGASGCIGVLAWLKLPPPSVPVPPQPVESLAPWARSMLVVPDKLVVSRIGLRVAMALIAFVVALAVGIASVWWLAFKQPSGKGWSVLATDFGNASVYDFGTPGVVVLETGQDGYVGIDLTTLRALWTRPGGLSIAGDATDVAVIDRAAMDIIDPTTGLTKASVDLSAIDSRYANSGKVLWVGDGRVLYHSSYSAPLCYAALNALGTCLWTAPDSDVDLVPVFGPNMYVFGGGQYVNTGDGVLMMATGQPASFGADAGQRPSGGRGVYFTGPSPDRVFRVEPSSMKSTFQPWDTIKDVPISQVVNATQVLADPAASSFLAIDSSDYLSRSQVGTFFDRQTGQQETQISINKIYGDSARFANSDWLAVIDRTKTVSVLVALDPASGREVWHGRSNSQLVGVVGNTIYVTDGLAKLWAYDMSNGFKMTDSTSLPSRMCKAAVAGGRVICLDRSTGSLWLMDA